MIALFACQELSQGDSFNADQENVEY